MAVIANITGWSGSDGEELTVSNAGWTTDTTAPFSTGTLNIETTGGKTSIIRTTDTNSKGYLRTETPGSANQTLRASVLFRGDLEDSSSQLVARYASGTFISAVYKANATQVVELRKTLSGTQSVVGTAYTISPELSALGEGTLGLRVSGSAPNITAVVEWNGVDVITETGANLNNSGFNQVGSVGIYVRTSPGGQGDTAGGQFTTFYAADDTSVAGQTLLPASDITTTGWTSSAGGALYAAIDEAVASDTDYIYSGTLNAECEIKLQSGSTPGAGSKNLKVRCPAGFTPVGNWTVSLYEGASLVQAFTTPAPTADTVVTFSVTNAITDYSNLRVRIKTNA